MRDRHRRAVRAMRRAECIHDEEVAALGQLPRVALVVLVFARVEACVLEHLEALIGQELAQTGRDRLDPVSGIRAFRPAEMRADADSRRVALEQQLERRQGGADSIVVRDPAVLERHVQVAADEHRLALDGRVPNRARPPQRSLPIRSTSRQL